MTVFSSARGENLARFHNIVRDLLAQCSQAFELLLRPEVTKKSQLNIFAVEIAIEIEEMKFQHALRASRGRLSA